MPYGLISDIPHHFGLPFSQVGKGGRELLPVPP
jgi:hypothetical protein